ncbi:unnamed protein product, partial [Effrenium voratum]
AVFVAILEGLRELVALVAATSLERSSAALLAAFEGLKEEDARDIASTLGAFCHRQPDEEAKEELMRLTVCFLLNSFGSSDEVRLCRFCALFNHSCSSVGDLLGAIRSMTL